MVNIYASDTADVIDAADDDRPLGDQKSSKQLQAANVECVEACLSAQCRSLSTPSTVVTGISGIRDVTTMKICIVGGGPVGCLSACVLAQDGHDVTVFEKRPDPRLTTYRGGRSINLSLSTRGIDALAAVNLDKDIIENHSVPVNGRLIHKLDGTSVPSYYGLKRELVTYSVNRQHLNDMLLHATERYSNIQQHFTAKIIHTDLVKGELSVQLRDSQHVTLAGPYDLILGCDGAHSVVRQEMLKAGLFSFSQQTIAHGYVEMRFPPTSDGQFALPPNFVHIWPRRDYLMIALPNLDRTYTVSLFLPHTQFDQLNAGGSTALLDFFQDFFPDAVPLVGEKALLSAGPLRPWSLTTVQCEPYHYGRAALLGDAAHAVVPFYAQGMNAGLEDCLIFRDILRSALRAEHVNLPLMLETYSKYRAQDGHAISKLSLYNYSELSTLVVKPTFQLRKQVDNALHQLFGSKWELMYNAVTFSRQRYSDCLLKRKAQDETLRVAGLSAAFFLLAAIFIFLVAS